MQKMFRRLRIALFTGGVGAALAFGAVTLQADVNPAAACELADGRCASDGECAKFCRGVVGAGDGQCSDGCCYCIWY